jgi:hypothetical protein
MHRLTLTGLAAAVLVAVVLLLARGAALADDQPPTACDPNSGSCTVTVTDPGEDGSSSTPPPGQDSGGTGCVGADGKDYPCYDPQFGYWSGKCYWKLMNPQPEYSNPMWDGHPAGEGAIYFYTCPPFTPGGDGGEGMEWEATQPGAPAVTPAELAQQAVKELVLPAPTLVLSPSGRQLVNLPTWLAVTGWAAQSATASVPGLSVTATASPTTVVWVLGDGGSVTCDGPGTVFAAGDDPASASPTCGHTYRASSTGQPDGAFTVSATVRWSVAWAGGGESGTLPQLTETATAAVPVAESQALSAK